MNNPVHTFEVTDSCNTTLRGAFTRSGDHDHRRLQHPDVGAVSAAQGALHSAPCVLRQHVQDAAAPWRAGIPRRTFTTTRRRASKRSWNSTCSSSPPIIGFPITDSNILLTAAGHRRHHRVSAAALIGCGSHRRLFVGGQPPSQRGGRSARVASRRPVRGPVGGSSTSLDPGLRTYRLRAAPSPASGAKDPRHRSTSSRPLSERPT